MYSTRPPKGQPSRTDRVFEAIKLGHRTTEAATAFTGIRGTSRDFARLEERGLIRKTGDIHRGGSDNLGRRINQHAYKWEIVTDENPLTPEEREYFSAKQIEAQRRADADLRLKELEEKAAASRVSTPR